MPEKQSNPPYKIFVSHYGHEKPIADAVKRVLYDAYAGHTEVFVSSDVPVGTDWLARIKENLTQANEIISVFTHKSVDRPWLNIETGFGIMQGGIVTPLLCRGFGVQDLPIQYRRQQAVDGHMKLDVLRLFNDVLTRIRGFNRHAQPKWDQATFWENWRQAMAEAEAAVPLLPTRPNRKLVVWFLGSHRTLPPKEQQKALQACRVIARACAKHKMQIVMGTSRMLEYLADDFANFMEKPELLADSPGEPWRKQIAEEHAQAETPVPNPIVLLGNLRSRGIREVFDDAIGLIPDIAVFIGGRLSEQSGRASEEQELAVAARIPFLPLKFTGGAAALAEDTLHDKLKPKVLVLQTLEGNMDRLGSLFVEITQEQEELTRQLAFTQHNEHSI